MEERESEGKPAGKDGEGAPSAPPEAKPLLPGIPEPEPSESPAPAPLPTENAPEEAGGESGPGRAQELEARLDHRLEAGLDRETERETEERLVNEIDQEVERALRQDLELQVESGAGQLAETPRTPQVVDLGAREEIPYATVLALGGPETAEPPAPRPEPPERKKLAKRLALRNRLPPEKAPAVNGRGANGRGMVNGRGLLNRRGISNGAVNGEGIVNGRGAVNGLRNRRGMSNGNGMTNGNGMVNGRRAGRPGRVPRQNGGLTDAEGRTNGRGMVNGRGIVNGEGITNGRRLTIGEAPPRPRRSALAVIAAAVVAVMLLVAGLYFLLASTEKGIHVDGAFSDWQGVPKGQDDIADQANPEINIVTYALDADGSSVSLYLRTEGRALGGRGGGVDSVLWFFDTDQDGTTGYRIDSVGAEMVLVVDGYDGRVTAAGLYRFPHGGARPPDDWNSRTAAGPCRAAAAGSELEAQTSLADLGVGAGSKFNAAVYTRDDSGAEDHAPVMSTERVRLTAFWSRVGPERTEAGASGVPLLRLELESHGGNASVGSLTVHASEALGDGDLARISVRTAAGFEVPGGSGALAGGRATLTFSPPLAVAPETTVSLSVLGDVAASAATGKAVGLSLEGGRDISAGTRAITVESGAVPLTYIGSPAGPPIIDGAFLDWEAFPDHPDPRGDVADPDIDVTGFRTATGAGSLFVYLRVDGQMMGGAGIPESKSRPPTQQHGGGGGPVVLPVLVGEDSAFVFIDADNDGSTGYSGGGLPLGADYMANFSGQYGRLGHQMLYAFSGGGRTAWSWTALGDVEAANDDARLEARLALTALGSPSGNLSLFYYTTDWRLERDTGDRLVLDLASGAGGRAPAGATGQDGVPEPPASGRDIWPLHAPEFREVLAPMAGLAAIVLMFRRRGRNALRRQEARANGLLTR